MGVVFIPLGAVCLGASNSVDEVRRRYDDDPACYRGFFPTDAEANRRRSDAGAGVTCELTITPRRTLKAPVYVYYELQNVLQNHRRFVKSRSDDQLAGRPAHDATFCEPKAYVVNSTDGVKREVNPCGLMAWSTFNDTYAFEVDGVTVPVNATGIAWRSDVEEKFADYAPANVNEDPSTRGGRAIGPSVSRDERFIVWMRTAALPKFRKLWGRIETDIPAGATVRVRVDNAWNAYAFGGSKALVLSTTSFIVSTQPSSVKAAYLCTSRGEHRQRLRMVCSGLDGHYIVTNAHGAESKELTPKLGLSRKVHAALASEEVLHRHCMPGSHVYVCFHHSVA